MLATKVNDASPENLKRFRLALPCNDGTYCDDCLVGGVRDQRW